MTTASFSDQVALATGTVYGPAHYVGAIDKASIDLYAASGSAASTVVVEVSNRYNPATDSPTDDTKWDTYAPSGWTAPASLTGAVSNYLIEVSPVTVTYMRLKFVVSSGTTALTATWQVKGA